MTENRCFSDSTCARDFVASELPDEWVEQLSVAHMQQERLTELYSYDEDFDRFEAIYRCIPEL